MLVPDDATTINRKRCMTRTFFFLGIAGIFNVSALSISVELQSLRRQSIILNKNRIRSRVVVNKYHNSFHRLGMVMATPDVSNEGVSSFDDKGEGSGMPKSKRRRRKKYQRKRPKKQSEMDRDALRKSRQERYEEMRKGTHKVALWDFESLFPDPVWDEETRYKDLYEVNERGSKDKKKIETSRTSNQEKSANIHNPKVDGIAAKKLKKITGEPIIRATLPTNVTKIENEDKNTTVIDGPLTRMVEDRLYGFRRSPIGDFQYETSLMSDGAVKFRDGVRLGNALKVNADKLNYHAKKELARGKLEEAEELYERAVNMLPRDGRGYLGLSRVAQRRRDFRYAKECLRSGIINSSSDGVDTNSGETLLDKGANPFLLQALGCLEERMGHLAEAEKLFIEACKSRPSHAAAWVSLAQLRTRKLRQGPKAGRICYQTAELELNRVGLPQSSHVYTAWASLECKAGDKGKARFLFQSALKIDPRCSAAWLQLGVMEAAEENWERAKECFETVLKYDKRNSRVLQAYAIMESKQPEGNSRETIELFERALRAKPRDGGVLQAYALYVVKLGDIDGARDL